MQRRVNFRLLLWTIGCVTVLAVGVNVLHAYQLRRNAHVVLERGDQALAKQEFAQALYYLGQYLALAPHDLDALEKFCLTLDKTARDPAEKVRVVLRLEDLLMRDAQRHEARARLVQNLMDLGRYQDAVVHLRQLLALRPDESALHHLVGRCQSASGASAAAAKSLQRALELDPTRIASYLLRADVLQRRLAQDDEAAQMIDKMVQANPQNPDAYLARSRFVRQRGQVAEAAKDLQQALDLAPDDSGVLLAAAIWADDQARTDDARKHLRRGLELHPKNAAFVKALANLELREGQRPEAMRVLRAGIAHAPDAFELHILLADLLIDAQQYDDAAQLIATMVRAGLPPAFPNYLQARLAVERRQWGDAIARLEKVRVDLGAQTDWSSRVYALLGACYEQVGDMDQRVAAWQRAVQIEPGWTAAKHGLGRALLAQGRFEDAVAELDAVSNAKDAPPDLWTALARAQLLAMLQRPEALRDWAAVERSLGKAAALDQASAELTLLRAEMLSARRAFDEARQLLQQARAGSKNVAFWTALVDLETRQEHFDDARKTLDDAAAIFGDHVELRLAHARLYGARGNDDDRAALLALAQGLDAAPLADRLRVWHALAQAWRWLGDAKAAEQMLQQIAQTQPSDLTSRLLLLEMTLQRGDAAGARRWVSDLRKWEGEQGTLWRWGKIALQVHEARGSAAKLADARAQLADLGRRRRAWPRVALLEASIDEIEGKWERVIENCVKAAEWGERHPRFMRRLVQLMVERRQFAQAEQVLLLAEERAPLPPDLARQAAEVAAANKHGARVHQLLAQLFPTAPRDYRDLLWVASLHTRIDEPTKAEVWLRKASAQAEHIPETWIALVEHLARTGQHDAAAAAVAQLQTKMPKQRLAYCLARCWDAAGASARAADAFTAALANQPHDFQMIFAAGDYFWRADQPERATPLYERLLDLQPAPPPELLASARRQLALCRAQTTQPTQAHALLDANRQAFGVQIEDERLRWFFDGQQPAQRRQAIQRLRESFGRYPSRADEELLLVQLEDAANDAPRARERLAHLLSAGESPQLIARYLHLLIKTEALDEALVWLVKLERWEPNSPRTQELKQLVSKASEKA